MTQTLRSKIETFFRHKKTLVQQDIAAVDRLVGQGLPISGDARLALKRKLRNLERFEQELLEYLQK